MKHRKRLLLLIMILVLSLLIPNVYADTFMCKFKRYSDQIGNYEVQDGYKINVVLTSSYDIADIIYKEKTNYALIIPNDEGGLTLIEIDKLGVVATTIDMKGTVVQSRNTVAEGSNNPSQYYGTCQLIPKETE